MISRNKQFTADLGDSSWATCTGAAGGTEGSELWQSISLDLGASSSASCMGAGGCALDLKFCFQQSGVISSSEVEEYSQFGDGRGIPAHRNPGFLSGVGIGDEDSVKS